MQLFFQFTHRSANEHHEVLIILFCSYFCRSSSCDPKSSQQFFHFKAQLQDASLASLMECKFPICKLGNPTPSSSTAWLYCCCPWWIERKPLLGNQTVRTTPAADLGTRCTHRSTERRTSPAIQRYQKERTRPTYELSLVLQALLVYRPLAPHISPLWRPALRTLE